MDQAENLVRCVLHQYKQLGKTGRPQTHEYTCLAAVAVELVGPSASASADRFRIVCLATGTKCLGGSARSTSGHLLHDSHAEVLARRGFMAWLVGEVQLALSSIGNRQPHSCMQLDAATNKLRLLDDLRVHMYISQPPCGDACIVASASQKPVLALADERIVEAQTSAQGISLPTSQELSKSQDSFRLRTGAKALKLMNTASNAEDSSVTQVYVPAAGDVESGPQQQGILRRKPGKGDPTLSLSCSDKLAKWCCMGIQGCLLSGLLQRPIYLSSLVVGMPPNISGACDQEAAQKSLQRAVAQRLQGQVESALTGSFRLTCPEVHVTDTPPADLGLAPSDTRKVGAGSSINWIAAPGAVMDSFMQASCKSQGLPIQRPATALSIPEHKSDIGLHPVTAVISDTPTPSRGIPCGKSEGGHQMSNAVPDASMASGQRPSPPIKHDVRQESVNSSGIVVAHTSGTEATGKLQLPMSSDSKRDRVTSKPINIKGSVEVTVGGDGFKAGASKAAVAAGKAKSRLCRAVLAKELVSTLKIMQSAKVAGKAIQTDQADRVDNENDPQEALHNQSSSVGDNAPDAGRPCSTDPSTLGKGGFSLPPDTLVFNDGLKSITYRQLKQGVGSDYCHAWRALRAQQAFQLWVPKPDDHSEFMVDITE